VDCELILVEYDVTRVGVYRAGEDRFLGMTLDEDQQWLRRVFVPVSDLALEALGRREITFRKVAKSAEQYFVQDEPLRGQAVRWWRSEVPPPTDVLPSPDSLLPPSLAGELLALLAKPAGEPEAAALHIEPTGGAGIPAALRRTHGAPLGTLGTVLSAFSEFFEGLGGVRLYGAATAPGSLRIDLASDPPDALDGALDAYARLVDIVDADESIDAALKKVPAGARDQAVRLFGTLADTRCDVLLRRPARASFVSPSTARALSAAPGQFKEPVSYRHAWVRGRVLGFYATDKARFVFHDTEHATMYAGPVDSGVVERLRNQRDSVQVGYRNVLYEAQLALPEEAAVEEKRARAAKPNQATLMELRPAGKVPAGGK